MPFSDALIPQAKDQRALSFAQVLKEKIKKPQTPSKLKTMYETK
jgi:hypothetical protein